MKKYLFSMVLGLMATLHHLHADVILIRTTANGGPRGYRTVTMSDAKLSDYNRTWMVHCQDPGISPCPNLPDFLEFDPWTFRVVKQLTDEVFGQCLNVTNTGTLQRVFQDPATGKKYLFTVVWEMADPLNSRLVVDKTEIRE